MDDGGPAFPIAEIPGVLQGHPGMSLRDWFAGRIAAAIVGNLLTDAAGYSIEVVEVIAKDSYAVADAMIAESKREAPARREE